MTPDLAAYNTQLRRVAWPLRVGGLALVLLGALVLTVAVGASEIRPLGFGLLGLGWGLYGYAFALRRRWAKTHPFEGPGA